MNLRAAEVILRHRIGIFDFGMVNNVLRYFELAYRVNINENSETLLNNLHTNKAGIIEIRLNSYISPLNLNA